ncbi:MAG: response regulator transcription factor [Deltaproteobacteria bacterium]|nr:response regulator transcription factor [Deltaproteobacteria bacterium]
MAIDQPAGESAVRVLVVEDQPQLLRGIVKMLSCHPAQVQVVGTAMDGETGLAEAARLRPELMLLDLELPGIDGIQVTERLKKAQPDVDVLILTSFDDEAKVYEAIRAGASGYLVKRVGIDKILSGIREVREGGTVLEPVIARRFWNYFQSIRAHPPQPADPFGLSPVELDVLRYVAKGLSNAEVGRVMSIERRTVRTHLAHIYRKLGVNTHVEAVIKAMRAGLVEL